MNFHVDDEVWNRVLPKHYAEGVVCLSCFDFFASAKGIGYEDAVKDVIFVGEAAHFYFGIEERHSSYKLAK